MSKTKITTLLNGLRVASSHTNAHTATVGISIDAGSRYETAKTNGAAHFLEHMYFKGTAERSRKQLEMEFEMMGGHFNAYTSREQTVFFAKVFKEDVGKAINILSDVILHSKLDDTDIEQERGVILREAEEVAKDMEETIFDHLHSVAYQNNSLGMTILGPEDNIRTLKQKQLKDFIKEHYIGPRMVLAAAGAVNHSELMASAEKLFGSLPKESPVPMPLPEINTNHVADDSEEAQSKLINNYVKHRFIINNVWVDAWVFNDGGISVKTVSYNPEIIALLKQWSKEGGGRYTPKFKAWKYCNPFSHTVLLRLREMDTTPKL